MNQRQPYPAAVPASPASPAGPAPQGPDARAAAHAEQRQGLHGTYSVRFGIGGWVFFTLQVVLALVLITTGAFQDIPYVTWQEIGRASCRERV